MDVFIFILIVILIINYVLEKDRFVSIGHTQGVCIDSKIEILDDSLNCHNNMRGRDRRLYRLYIKYEWEGEEYTARSYRSYSRFQYFPGDILTIAVGKDKSIVDILT